jgi:ATP-dependent helicase/nuclease subunit B
MGVAGTEIDAWLLNGGLVITASDRAARALAAAFHRARLTEGLAAWPAPQVQDWSSFVAAAWQQRAQDGRLLLNPTQEQSLWAEIAAAAGHEATLLEGPRHRLAALAMKAHDLLCSHAPQFLKEKARSAWQQDAAAFSGWLSAFDRVCRAGNLFAPSRLPLELTALLQEPSSVPEPNLSQRPPLMLAGFDRILPAQRALFDAWGAWHEAAPGTPAAEIHFHKAADFEAELSACARWCNSRVAANPGIRLLVITQQASARRGQIEREFLNATDPRRIGSAPFFEFSLGVPLSQIALAHGALLVLRWLNGSLAEEEVDWLLSTGQTAASPEESLKLEAYMRALRRRGLERTHWTLAAFVGQPPAAKLLPTRWLQHITEARRRLESIDGRPQSPLDWAGAVPHLLEAAGWPGFRSLSSGEFQSLRRWQQAVDAVGSLGFDGRRIGWQDFLSALARTLDETLFAPESHDAPIQIAGPAESAGLTADAIWFLSADEDAWPPTGSMHPLLPHDLQRAAAMPHASAQLDGDLAQSITDRLLASAPEINFSFARQTEIAEARPSRLIAKIAGPPQELPKAPPGRDPLTILFEDSSRIPFPPGEAEGGSSVLTSQSQCPFKAFATARLAAQGWQLAQAGLTPSQRGQLLHSVLHDLWAGPPDGIRTRDHLQNLKDRSAFVASHVHRVFASELRREVRQIMPRRYLELEEQRLIRLVTEWLDYEATRIDFEVEGTEVERTITLAGLTLNLRLDRIDRLNDGTVLIIDYKSGDVSPHLWDLPRPDDVQLPLYAGFALDREEPLGGLVFAKIRPGNQAFVGSVAAAKDTLLPNLSGGSSLVKNSLTLDQLLDWRNCIQQLARDFVDGNAEVAPREAPQTCARCGLQTLCRIHENEARLPSEAGDDSDGSTSQEAADE